MSLILAAYTHNSDWLVVASGIVLLGFLVGYGALTDSRWKHKPKRGKP